MITDPERRKRNVRMHEIMVPHNALIRRWKESIKDKHPEIVLKVSCDVLNGMLSGGCAMIKNDEDGFDFDSRSSDYLTEEAVDVALDLLMTLGYQVPRNEEWDKVEEAQELIRERHKQEDAQQEKKITCSS